MKQTKFFAMMAVATALAFNLTACDDDDDDVKADEVQAVEETEVTVQPSTTYGGNTVDMDIVMGAAGDLATVFEDDEPVDIATLKISGPINGDDVQVLRTLFSDAKRGDDYSWDMINFVKTIDLSEAQIVEGGSYTYQNSNWESITTTTKNNVFPEYMLAGRLEIVDEQGALLTGFSYEKIILPNSITEIGEGACSYVEGLNEVVINYPDNITKIGDYAFAQAKITSINLPNNLTEIPNGLFYYCSNLEDYEIPETVTKIGDYAFNSCYSIPNFDIPEGVTYIGDYAFRDCSGITEVSISDNVTYLGAGAFAGCQFTHFELPERFTEIPESFFSGCSNLETFEFSQSITHIGVAAFSSCRALNNIVIPDAITEIEERTFTSCSSLTNITLSDNITKIGYEAFFSCDGLTEIQLPSKLTEIGDEAFAYSSNLEQITLPESLTLIGANAFSSCSLQTVYCYATNPPTLTESQWDTGSGFSSNRMLSEFGTLYVPQGALETYQNSEWSQYFYEIKEMK